VIVNFTTRYGRVQMHGEAAVALLRLAGHSGTVPGAVLAAELPAALAALKTGLATEGENIVPPPQAADLDHEQSGEPGKPTQPSVRLRTRAVPLIDLIERAVATGSDLQWERA
jgi:hypothetical protein